MLNIIKQDALIQLGYIWLHISAVTGQLQANWEQYEGTALFLPYHNIVRSLSEDGRLRPKHVAKYNLIALLYLVLMIVVYWR